MRPIGPIRLIRPNEANKANKAMSLIRPILKKEKVRF